MGKLDELEAQVNDLIQKKNTELAELADQIKEDAAGMEQAEADSDKWMKEGNLKKYSDAKNALSFHRKRYELHTRRQGFLEGEQNIPEADYEKIRKAVRAEQLSALEAQEKQIPSIVEELKKIAEQTDEVIKQGNKILMMVSVDLFKEVQQDGYQGTEYQNYETIPVLVSNVQMHNRIHNFITDDGRTLEEKMSEREWWIHENERIKAKKSE